MPLEVIKEIINGCCQAPSSGNRQPWRFIIVTNKELIKQLSEESKQNILSRIQQNPDDPMKRYESKMSDKGYNVFYQAPCLVYIVGPRKIPTITADCTLAASYFMFLASEKGLGTCWVGLG